MIHILTVITENYLGIAHNFLASMDNLQNINPICICVNFHPSKVANKFNIESFLLKTDKEKSFNGFLQHGEWLNAKYSFNNDDIYIIVDADAVIQRDLTLEEINRFSKYDDNTIGIGFNCTQLDTFEQEIPRLIPTIPNIYDIMTKQYGSMKHRIYNTGMMVGRLKLFKRLNEFFNKHWNQFSTYFIFPPKTQLLQNIGFRKLGFNIDELGYELHTHGHWLPLPEGMVWDEHDLVYNNQKVFFRHNYPRIKNKTYRGLEIGSIG